MGLAFVSRALTFADGPGSTEHTAEAFAVSDIVGPPWKANENWDGRMVRGLFLSEVSNEVWLCAADTRSSDADSQF